MGAGAFSGTRTPIFLRDTMGDAAKTYGAGVTDIALTVVLTAARVLTLPAANSLPASSLIIFSDEIGGVTSTNTVSVAPAGSDLLNGAASAFVLYTTNVLFALKTDGISKWTGGIITSPSDGTYQAYVPSFTGHSTDPTVADARYAVWGKTCRTQVQTSAGTSNATTFTITLPVAAANTQAQTFVILIANAGTLAFGRIVTRINSTTADVYPSAGGTAWTASGVKNCSFTIVYETV